MIDLLLSRFESAKDQDAIVTSSEMITFGGLTVASNNWAKIGKQRTAAAAALLLRLLLLHFSFFYCCCYGPGPLDPATVRMTSIWWPFGAGSNQRYKNNKGFLEVVSSSQGKRNHFMAYFFSARVMVVECFTFKAACRRHYSTRTDRRPHLHACAITIHSLRHPSFRDEGIHCRFYYHVSRNPNTRQQSFLNVVVRDSPSLTNEREDERNPLAICSPLSYRT